MTQVWHFIKLACAVIFGFAAAVVLVIVPGANLALPLAATSIAFSVMPE